MRLKVEIAFRRKVRAVWLDQGLALAVQGVPWAQARRALADTVAKDNPGTETVRKVLEHIHRIWFEPPRSCAGLHADALGMAEANDSPETRFVLNWGMAIAACPFVGSVAEAIGRLLKLQNEVHRGEIQRRLHEQYGDRDFVSRITRYNVSSFLDWGLIAEIRKRGRYGVAGRIDVPDARHLAWLVEAVLVSRALTQITRSHLDRQAILFPFRMSKLDASTLRENPRLTVGRQGLGEEYVTLQGSAACLTF